MKKEDRIYQLELMGENIIDMFNSFIKYAETYNLINEQEFLETLDEMNKLSVKY